MTVDELLAYCESSDDVIAAYLFGSRGRSVGVDEKSDWDVWIVASMRTSTCASTRRVASSRACWLRRN